MKELVGDLRGILWGKAYAPPLGLFLLVFFFLFSIELN
jgi:hypothetical protein